MNMLKHVCLALGVACGLLMAAPGDALAARTGIVDVNRVYTESKAGKAADAHLDKQLLEQRLHMQHYPVLCYAVAEVSSKYLPHPRVAHAKCL